MYIARPPMPNRARNPTLWEEICPAITNAATTARACRKFQRMTHESSRDAIIAGRLAAADVHNCRAPELVVAAPEDAAGRRRLAAPAAARLLGRRRVARPAAARRLGRRRVAGPPAAHRPPLPLSS